MQTTGAADLDDVIDRIIQQGSTVVKSDILSVLEDYHMAIENMVLEGLNVTTPAAVFGASLKGVFNGQADRYDPSRHQVAPTVSAGVRLRKAIAERARVVKQEAVKPRPSPLEYTDKNAGERNSVLTPGGMGQIVGHRLKFDPSDEEQGVYFVAEDGTATRAEVIGRNMPAKLIF